jgi:hypothetical protein
VSHSGTFVRDEPVAQTGFAALDFSAEQIDAFFEAADKLQMAHSTCLLALFARLSFCAILPDSF